MEQLVGHSCNNNVTLKSGDTVLVTVCHEDGELGRDTDMGNCLARTEERFSFLGVDKRDSPARHNGKASHFPVI
jgi:hypothetical protein